MFDQVLVERTAEDDAAAALAYARSHAGRSMPAQDLAVRWALAHPHAARLAAAPPGPGLAETLTDLAIADAPSEDLLEAVGAWDRVGAWAAAQQATVLQELHRRVECSTWAQKGLRDEVAGTLAVSGRAAHVLLSRALELAEAPEVHDALRDGVVSVSKAGVLLRDTATLPGPAARRIHRDLLDDASQMTAPQLSAATRGAVLQLDPEAAEARHRRAREDRCVVLEPAGDCMATLRAYLPAVDAVAAMRALDAVAATAATDDPRGIDARRADALVDVLGAVLDRGVAPDGTPVRGRAGRTSSRLFITVSANALAGASGTPAQLDGYGPVVPSLARRLADEATWHFQRTDAATGEALEQPGSRYRPPEALRAAIVARDVTCTFPGCRTAARSCDLDHTDPYDDARDPASQTRRSNLGALCRHHHRLKTHGGWTPRRDPDTGVVVWTSPTGKPYTRDPVPAPAEPEPPRRWDPSSRRSDPTMGWEAGPPDATATGHPPDALRSQKPPDALRNRKPPDVLRNGGPPQADGHRDRPDAGGGGDPPF